VTDKYIGSHLPKKIEMRNRLRFKTFLILILGTINLGCSTQPIKVSEAKSIPEKHIYNRPSVSSKLPARVFIIRDGGFRGSAFTITLKIDGLKLADFDPGEKFDVQINPGKHVFAISCWTCGISEIETVIDENETGYYRISFQDGPFIQRSAEISD
jgi:hypothetical protein